MQKELHHSKNPPMIQEQVDLAKTTEWLTLRDVLPPAEARKIRANKPDRVMTSRFVARWCLRGHHDPDLLQKVVAGKRHSPTLSQFGQSLILQMIVSHKWTMHLGDIKEPS